MNISIIGSGGREHAFAQKISESDRCDKLFVIPGNGGTGINVNLSVSDFQGIGKHALENNVEMIVVGPEIPLVEGIYDYFTSKPELAKIKIIGPSKDGAILEGSKAFSKKFMERHGIPTAKYAEFTTESFHDGIAYLEKSDFPIVLKADGLAAGKGVLICEDMNSAKQGYTDILGGQFGEAGNVVVIEEFMKGIEVSVFTFTDGVNYKILPTAKDYKRIGEQDKGLNTGGMGAVSPVPFADETFMAKVEEQIILPTIKGLKEEGRVYKGVIYFGLMNVMGDPKVVEYNCRFGDPEAEVLLPKIKSDLVDILEAIADEKLNELDIAYFSECYVTTMLVSDGYPGSYEKGKEITLPENQSGFIYHAGTKLEKDKLLTNGGRVLSVTATGKDLDEARRKSQEIAESIEFAGKYFRRDIGFDLI